MTPLWWQPWIPVVGALAGAAVGFFLAQGTEWLRRRRQRRGHWAALRAEIDFCWRRERYLSLKSRKKSLANDTRIVKHLKADLGKDTPLAEITADRISEYRAKRLAAVRKIGTGDSVTERRLTAAAINRPLALLRHLLLLAREEWGALDAVPRIRLEREPQGRVRWLEPHEEVRLMDACAKSRTKHLAAVVRVALETSLRRGELLSLQWDQIDMSRGLIRLADTDTKSGRRREGGVFLCGRQFTKS
jgi:integrase